MTVLFSFTLIFHFILSIFDCFFLINYFRTSLFLLYVYSFFTSCFFLFSFSPYAFLELSLLHYFIFFVLFGKPYLVSISFSKCPLVLRTFVLKFGVDFHLEFFLFPHQKNFSILFIYIFLFLFLFIFLIFILYFIFFIFL